MGDDTRRHFLLRLVAAAVALALIVTVGVFVAWRIAVKNSATVSLEISQHRVSKAEFAYALNTVRNEVIQETAGKGSSVSKDYWESEAPGSPTAKAVDRAIEVIRQRLGVYEIAVEAGIVDSASWDAITDRMSRENAAREQKKTAGQIVHGNPNYTLETFIDTEMRSIKQSYTSNTENPGMSPTENDIQRYYDNHEWTVSEDGSPATLDQVRANVVQEYRYSRYDELVQQRVKNQDIKKDLAQLRTYASSQLSE